MKWFIFKIVIITLVIAIFDLGLEWLAIGMITASILDLHKTAQDIKEQSKKTEHTDLLNRFEDNI